MQLEIQACITHGARPSTLPRLVEWTSVWSLNCTRDTRIVSLRTSCHSMLALYRMQYPDLSILMRRADRRRQRCWITLSSRGRNSGRNGTSTLRKSWKTIKMSSWLTWLRRRIEPRNRREDRCLSRWALPSIRKLMRLSLVWISQILKMSVANRTYIQQWCVHRRSSIAVTQNWAKVESRYRKRLTRWQA